MVGAIILVIVVVIGGAVAAFSLSGGTKGTTITSCTPANSPVCVASAATEDINLLVPVQSTLIGQSTPFTASLPTGETASEFTFNFGDGSPTDTITGAAGAATASYSYASPGTYLVQVTADVNGVTHNNNLNIGYLEVRSTYGVAAAQLVPAVSASILSNSSSTSNPTGVVALGGSVTITGTYTGTPINAQYAAVAPSLAILSGPSGGASLTSKTITTATGQGTFLFSSAGTYTVGFIANANSSSGSASQNNTFTVIAGSGGVAKTPAYVTAPSTQASRIVSYDNTGGSGPTTLDPAIDYETVGYEPLENVYQTLVQYNTTSVTSFVPMAAACVPGSTQCTTLFGENLTDGYNYTYVLSGASQFYDPVNKGMWGVYPTDVVYSFARTASFAVIPSWGGNNGWIEAQAFLPSGNSSWDQMSITGGAGIHAPGNNTPYQIFSHLLVNDSNFCPAAAYGAGYHGCVTIVANGLGEAWTPVALDQLMTDNLGASITPAGWMSCQGSPLPDWNISCANGGDHPVTLPSDSSSLNASSQDPGFQAWMNYALANPTMWDASQIAGSGALGFPTGSVAAQDIMAGSGPYYMSYFDNGVEYTLSANPGYAPNPDCIGSVSCQPATTAYVPSVTQYWENGPDAGIAAIEAGQAAVASFSSTDTSLLLQLVSQGKVQFTQFPTLGIFFYPFDWDFNLASAQALTPTTITAPTDFFSSEAMRMFFSTAYPYESIYKAILDVDGVVAGANYGGAIAPGMQYYPTNVTWPNTDPSATPTPTVNTSAWFWWHEAITPGNPYYDSEIATDCTPSTPCTLPIIGQTGNPPGDIQNALWIAQINKISGGAINALLVDTTFFTIVIGSLYSSPGQSPLPVYTLGWSPDYPNPTDYITPLWQANSTYTFGDAVSQQANLPAQSSGAAGCPGATDFGAWATYSQNNPGIPQACQGLAYQAMLLGFKEATHTPSATLQALYYAMISQIGRALALYTYQDESLGAWNVAPWIHVSSLNTQLTSSAGGDDDVFYQITGNGLPG
ncbi:MAG: PKD domain-containing protein [Thermoplasmata archaeon]